MDLARIGRPAAAAAAALLLLGMARSRRRLLRRLERLAYEDPLTGGANERKFLAEAGRLLSSRPRLPRAVVAFHVEKFRVVNELFGYENGTKALRGIDWVLRKNAGAGELCAHIQADRFALLLSAPDRDALAGRLDRIRADLRDTVEFYGIHYELAPFFGVCECPADGRADVRELLDRAVTAQKADRPSGGGPYAFFDERMRLEQMTLKNMADRLGPAMEHGEFEVWYQPKYELAGGTLCGAEALVRWRTDPETAVPPDEFIPVFERSGRIAELDRYVFDRVCRDLSRWRKEGRTAVPVSVNLSRVSLLRPSLAREYRAAADRLGAPAELLELELTESAFSQDRGTLTDAMERLREAGFTLSVDDFGSGYSSLNLLRDIPAQVLKLDREFLSGLDESGRGRTIVTAAVDLASRLGMAVVAEGVETREQAGFLRDIRCTAAQGFYFSPPVPAERFEELLPLRAGIFEAGAGKSGETAV